MQTTEKSCFLLLQEKVINSQQNRNAFILNKGTEIILNYLRKITDNYHLGFSCDNEVRESADGWYISFKLNKDEKSQRRNPADIEENGYTVRFLNFYFHKDEKMYLIPYTGSSRGEVQKIESDDPCDSFVQYLKSFFEGI